MKLKPILIIFYLVSLPSSSCKKSLVRPFINFSQHYSLIKTSIREKGYYVIQKSSSKEEDIIAFSKFFGKIQGNKSCNTQGISSVISEKLAKNKSGIISDSLFFPHTDGAYLKGINFSNDYPRKLMPPKFVLLQCVKGASKGGESVLIDSQKILKDLIQKDKKNILKILFSNCTNYKHNDIIGLDLPVFSKVEFTSYSIRWSYDRELYIEPEAIEAVNEFNDQYIMNNDYKISLKLNSGQILAIDNKRMLHGRNQFYGNRFFRRLWICDDVMSTPLINVQTNLPYYQTKRAYADNPYLDFAPIKQGQSSNDTPLEVPSGINITKEESKKLKNMLTC